MREAVRALPQLLRESVMMFYFNQMSVKQIADILEVNENTVKSRLYSARQSMKKYLEQYDHPVWQKYEAEGVREGHGGMDWLVLNAFFDALKANKPMPINVYDMAAWMSITPLSEQSILRGSASVEIPDFTNGKWCVSFDHD